MECMPQYKAMSADNSYDLAKKLFWVLLFDTWPSVAIHILCGHTQSLWPQTIPVAIHKLCGHSQSLRPFTISVAIHKLCGHSQSLWLYIISVVIRDLCGHTQSLQSYIISVAIHNFCGHTHSLWSYIISVAIHRLCGCVFGAIHNICGCVRCFILLFSWCPRSTHLADLILVVQTIGKSHFRVTIIQFHYHLLTLTFNLTN